MVKKFDLPTNQVKMNSDINFDKKCIIFLTLRNK
jgi:hypothetical protein